MCGGIAHSPAWHSLVKIKERHGEAFDPNLTPCGPEGLLPLHFAVGAPGEREHTDCLEFALDLKGLDVNQQNEPQKSMRMDSLLSVALNGGCQPMRFNYEGGGQTAMHVAAGAGKSRCVKLLIADPRTDLNLAGKSISSATCSRMQAKTCVQEC